MKSAGLIAVAFFLLLSAPVLATGTVRIQQNDDSVQNYTGVTMRIVGKMLMLTSADKVSTVVIRGTDCNNTGDLVTCRGGNIALMQNGSHPIPFRSATFYFNLTDQDQQLPLSTLKVPAHSVVFAARTAKGTYITGSGRLDQEPAK